MQSEQTKRNKRSTNKIMAARIQFFEFDVEAEKPENALNRLRARNRADLSPDMPENARLITSTWVDPSEEGAAWIFRNETFPNDPTGRTVHTWDGKSIARQHLPEGITESVLFRD